VLLAIDQGNKRTKCALVAGNDLVDCWIVPTRKDADPAALAADLFREHAIPAATPLGLCSVVPELLPAWQAMAADRGFPLTVITGTTPTPLENRYETPETLGPDRLLAAVAASALVGTPVVSISLGTATVVDAVSGDGAYLGGMIAPGIGLDIDTLASAASALFPVAWQEPARAVGRTSTEAITSGLFHHALGGLRAMIAAARAEIGAAAPLALTGGWSPTLAPYLDGVALVDEWLVVRGVAMVVG
jgi:type III pantothenate kinase